MNTVAKLEKIEAGRYQYRGVKIYKYNYQGFSYKFSVRTDTHWRTDSTFPVSLKEIAAKIDNDIDVNKNVVDHAGYVVKDTRTKVGA